MGFHSHQLITKPVKLVHSETRQKTSKFTQRPLFSCEFCSFIPCFIIQLPLPALYRMLKNPFPHPQINQLPLKGMSTFCYWTSINTLPPSTSPHFHSVSDCYHLFLHTVHISISPNLHLPISLSLSLSLLNSFCYVFPYTLYVSCAPQVPNPVTNGQMQSLWVQLQAPHASARVMDSTGISYERQGCMCAYACVCVHARNSCERQVCVCVCVCMCACKELCMHKQLSMPYRGCG